MTILSEDTDLVVKEVVTGLVLDETTKDLVDQVFQEVEDKVVEETTKDEDLVEQVLQEVEDELLNETTKDLVDQVLQEDEDEVLVGITAKTLVSQVLQDVKTKFFNETINNLDHQEVQSEGNISEDTAHDLVVQDKRSNKTFNNDLGNSLSDFSSTEDRSEDFLTQV